MPYTILITHTPTGETREMQELDTWGENAKFLWTEGNFACDCNRHLFFHLAHGHEPEEDCPCGEDVYSAKAILPGGEEVDLG